MPTALAGERIKSVRQLFGISQVELAEAASVSQSLISQVENGTREASEELIQAIAQATATPRSFFDMMPPDIPFGTLRFRKLASARQTDTKRVKVLFDEAFRVVAELMENANYPAPDLPAATGEVSLDEIEEFAACTRDALQLDAEGPIKHLTRACERAGIAVVPITLPSADDDENELIGHFGVSCWPSRDEPALIGYFSGGPGDRHRYTIAHELAHLVLHSNRRVIKDPEAEANAFAGALLLPEATAREIFSGPITLSDLWPLKAYWGISGQALIMRGVKLGLIDERRRTSLFKQLSARGWRKSEPVTVHREEPTLVWRLLGHRFGEPVVYPRLADPLGLQAVILRSLAPPPTPNRRKSALVAGSFGSTTTLALGSVHPFPLAMASQFQGQPLRPRQSGYLSASRKVVKLDGHARLRSVLPSRVWRTQAVANLGSGGRSASGLSTTTLGYGSGRLTLSCLVVSGTGIT
jgi:Zn-dependent peptidase ImmA (M78 family)/predicted transcriptional regulator